MSIAPPQHRVIPEDAVGGFQHPVILIREHQQPALNAAPLQRREGTQALRVRDAEVLLAVNDQHRSVPPGDEVDGVDRFVALRVLILRSAQLPLGKPQLLGGVVHRALVEQAVVVDDATEAIRPMALDPVHHEAPVGGTERTDTLPVEPRVLLDRGRESLLQVDEGLPAPVAADGVGESLAVTGRAVEVDHHHRVAAAGEGLRVPAVGPQVPEAHLGVAVYAATVPLATSLARAPVFGSTRYSASWPDSSTLASSVLPSGVAPRRATERSQPPVRERAAPVCASFSTM